MTITLLLVSKATRPLAPACMAPHVYLSFEPLMQVPTCNRLYPVAPLGEDRDLRTWLDLLQAEPAEELVTQL
jgi:hypothetical protein